MSWDDLEELVVASTIASVEKLLTANPGHTLYVVGLHSAERQEEGILTLPLLGANSLQAYAEDHDDLDDGFGFWGMRWNPSGWRWPQLVRDDPRLLLAEVQLHRLATCGSQTQWMRTEARMWRSLAAACRRIGANYRGDPRVASDFVVLIMDRAGGPRLARRGMSERLYQRHFPEQATGKREHRRVAAMPIDGQIDYLIGRLGEHSGDISTAEAAERLRDIGAPAIEPLIEKLADPQLGWYAAMLLGQIGVASERVLKVLRKDVRDTRMVSHRGWCASALAFLGDSHYLLDRVHKMPDSIIATGVTAPLSLFRDRCRVPPPLDYGPVRRLIDSTEELDALAEQELHPENGVCAITNAEVPTAIAALSEDKRAIRWHACTVLGDPGLASELAEVVVPALTARLTDPDPTAASLAARSLRRWTR